MKKRILTMLLMLALCLFMYPAFAFAEGDETQAVEPQQTEQVDSAADTAADPVTDPVTDPAADTAADPSADTGEEPAVEPGDEPAPAEEVIVPEFTATAASSKTSAKLIWYGSKDKAYSVSAAIGSKGDKNVKMGKASFTKSTGVWKMTVKGLTRGKTYTFTLFETGEDGTNTKIDKCKFKTEPLPVKVSLKVTAGGKKSAVLAWTIKNGSGSAKVYVDGKLKKTVSKKTVKLTKLAVGTHKIYVKVGKAKSNTVTVKVRPADVKGLKTWSSYNSVILKWKKSADADGYVIKRATKENGKYKTVKTIKKAANVTYTDPIDELEIDKTYYYKVFAAKNGVLSEEPAVASDEAVRTIHYGFRFKTTRELYSHTGGKVKAIFKKDTYKSAKRFAYGKYVFMHNGLEYQVSRISTKSHSVSQINTDEHYSAEEATYYVNARRLYSKTKYLIWVNAYTQQEYIFKGSKGKWQLLHNWEVSTGKPSTPTATGMTEIKRKSPKWHDRVYWSVCKVYSIHGKSSRWVLGYPRSGGCVRNTNEHAKWIYYTCPVKTRVYLF